MSDYNKSTNFTAKDTLPSGNSGKIVKGTELDIEFTNIASAVASKADTNSPTFTGTPAAPTATAGTNTTQLATCAFVLANSVPSGLISMWSGAIAAIPSGWYLCNGSNGTPDLRDRFIIGASSDSVGVAKTNITGSLTLTGGTKDAINVSHTHTLTDPGHTHSYLQATGGAAAAGGGSTSFNGNISGTTGSSTTGISISTEGSSGTNQNLPPYYALAYIMKA